MINQAAPSGPWLADNSLYQCWPDTWGDALDTSIVLPQSGRTVGGVGDNVASDHYPGFPDPSGC